MVTRARRLRIYAVDTNGNVVGAGAVEAIVFTSLTDDSIAGDANGDGDTTMPDRGYLESLNLEGPGNVLENLEVRYVG